MVDVIFPIILIFSLGYFFEILFLNKYLIKIGNSSTIMIVFSGLTRPHSRITFAVETTKLSCFNHLEIN